MLLPNRKLANSNLWQYAWLPKPTNWQSACVHTIHPCLRPCILDINRLLTHDLYQTGCTSSSACAPTHCAVSDSARQITCSTNILKKRQKVQERSIAHLQPCTSHAVNRSDVPLITASPPGKTHFLHCLCCEYMMDIEQVRSTVRSLRHSPLFHHVEHIYMHNSLQLRSTFWRYSL